MFEDSEDYSGVMGLRGWVSRGGLLMLAIEIVGRDVGVEKGE